MRVRTHTNPLNIRHRFDPNLLDNRNPSQSLDLEIGFGRGVFLRYWAQQCPLSYVVGVEVRQQMVDILQSRVTDPIYDHVHLFHGNGIYFLEDAVQDGSVDRLFIFHPDPWFKKRHHKRRVVTDQYSQLLFQKLKPTGRLYVSTDVDLLWQDMREALVATSFKPLLDDDFWETHYQTHWHQFSLEDKRSVFFQTFYK